MTEKLEEVMEDFVESCIRTGHHNRDANIEFFMKENDHMDITKEEVETAYDEAMEEFE